MTINQIINNFSFLPKNDIKKLLPYVAASCTSVGNDESWITPFKLSLISPASKQFPISSETLKAHDKCFFDPSSGLKISLVQGEKELIIAFGPMGSGDTEVAASKQKEISRLQLTTGILNLLGSNCHIYEQASKLVEELIKLNEFKDKNIVIVGQSLGGSLAQYVGLKTQLPTYCFNPVPLGRSQIKKLRGDQKTQDDKITVISVGGDYATLIAEHTVSKIAKWVIDAPTLYGKKCTIPSAYGNANDTHTYFMGSVMKYLGYDIRTKIDALPPHELYVANDAKAMELAISDLKRSVTDLCELKAILNENNVNKCTEKLQLIKNTAPWIFNYLSFVIWLANEGRDFGDFCYGEHRLLETPQILNKISIREIPILDSLIEHLSVLLFLQHAKKSFLHLSEKAQQLTQNFLSCPMISKEKSDLDAELHSILNSIEPVKKVSVFAQEGLHLLLELQEELQNKKGGSEKQKKILEEISNKYPQLYFSMLLLLKQQMNQPTLKAEILSQLIQANPIVLINLFNGKQSILMQLIEMYGCIEQMHTAIDHLERLKNFILKHYQYASNFTTHVAFQRLEDLYQKVEELEVAFSLVNDQKRLLHSFKNRCNHLCVSSKEAIQPNRFIEQNAVAKRIYMVAAECTGIIKVGGLGEAVLGIAEGLRDHGHEVTLIMPKYSTFPQDGKREVKNALELTPIALLHSFGDVVKVDRVFVSQMKGITMLFIEDTAVPGLTDWNRFSLEGNSLYEIPKDRDEIIMKERFAYFGQAAAELIKELKEQIDVVMLHDWHSALAIPLLARNSTKQWIERSLPPLIYVFHNNGYSAQGIINDRQHPSLLSALKLPLQTFNITGQAVSVADHVCTVSESYALEVQDREGKKLQSTMRDIAYKDRFSGVTNGCNLSLWNPYTEKQLVNWIDPITKEPTPIHFDHTGDLLRCKWRVKQQLQRWLFQYHPEIIEKYGVDVTRDNVILYVNRYDSSQKGVDKLRLAMRVAAEKGATFIAMGCKEDPRAAQLLDELEQEAAALKNPSWGGAWIIRDSFNESGSLNFQHGTAEGVPGIGYLVRAAANICFCPSKYEPCGLTHLEGFAYAQLTVGTNLGGYADLICEDTQSPLFNGFLFTRDLNWKSEKQNQAILKRMGEAIDYWNSLNNEQKNAIMNNLIQVSKQYTWTTAPHGLTPIEKYERVIAAAEKTSLSRGASERFHPLLLSESKDGSHIVTNHH